MCTRLHIATTTLENKCTHPQIGNLGKPRPDDQVQIGFEEVMRSRELAAFFPQRVTSAMMSEHLIIPSNDHNLIHSFGLTLKKDMKILSQNSTVHEVTLESMLFTRVILIATSLEV